MEYNYLGKTDIYVSKLCFGSLTVGSLQANMDYEKAGKIILEAFNRGINFIDTAQLYGSYPHIKWALKRTNKDIVVSTKTYAYTKELAKEALDEARLKLDRDVIDIFMLHEQESEHTIRGHWPAAEFFLKCKQKGLIRAFGISTHHIRAVKAAISIKEIDIIHPIINHKGLGIRDGSIYYMLEAVEQAYNIGKGIFAMKPLGGGNLIQDYSKCMNFILDLNFIHSIAIGMQSIEELEANISYFENRTIKKDIMNKLKSKKRKIHIDFWCEGCGNCVQVCNQEAISFENNKAKVDFKKCILCGYCSSSCPVFAIKIV